MGNGWFRYWVRTHNHVHNYAFHAFKLPKPEGGTYYQLKCQVCPKRNGERRFKPQQIMAPCVAYTIKVPLDLMPLLDERAQADSVAQVDWIGRAVRKELMRRV